MSYDGGELNRFFGSRIWRDITEDLIIEIDKAQLQLLEETEPIKLGKLQGRIETLRKMANIHQSFMSEVEANNIREHLDSIVDNKSGFIEKYTPFEEMVERGGDE